MTAGDGAWWCVTARDGAWSCVVARGGASANPSSSSGATSGSARGGGTARSPPAPPPSGESCGLLRFALRVFGIRANAHYTGCGVSQGITPAFPGRVEPEMQALAPRGVAAVPDLRYGEGKKSPLRSQPADNIESATHTAQRVLCRTARNRHLLYGADQAAGTDLRLLLVLY